MLPVFTKKKVHVDDLHAGEHETSVVIDEATPTEDTHHLRANTLRDLIHRIPKKPSEFTTWAFAHKHKSYYVCYCFKATKVLQHKGHEATCFAEDKQKLTSVYSQILITPNQTEKTLISPRRSHDRQHFRSQSKAS